jgi:HDOD domain
MIVPSTIRRIEPVAPIAIELLNRIPLPAGDGLSLEDALQREPALRMKINEVAMRAGRYAAAGSDEESVIGRISPADLVEFAITISVHDYLRAALTVAEANGYWRYIVACADCCAELAVPAKVDSLLAYASGLLHDIGRLALIQAYPERYANLLALTDTMFAADQPFDILHYEQMLFGFNHFATATWVAEVWNLPPWLRPVVGKFDDQTSADFGNLVATVRAGTRLAHSIGFGYLQAAPRTDVGVILRQLPGALGYWKALDFWKYGEEHMRSKIQARLNWYAHLSAPRAST